MLEKDAIDSERLDTLLALALAFNRRREQGENSESENGSAESGIENAAQLLSALNETARRAVEAKIAHYKTSSDEEKRVWESRVLKRISAARALRLDPDIHCTQIAAVLRREPRYIQQFILQRLPIELGDQVAAELKLEVSVVTLDLSKFIGKNVSDVNAGVEKLLRQRFLSNFVARENLYETKPLTLISGEDALVLLQQLGREEVALVCRGIKEIENLAPFLRQFNAEDAAAILERMAKIETADRSRIAQAEKLVHEVWKNVADTAVVVQHVGLNKLSAALAVADPQHARHALQKLPINLAAKAQKRIVEIQNQIEIGNAETIDLVEILAAEAQTAAARILPEKMQQNETAKSEKSEPDEMQNAEEFEDTLEIELNGEAKQNVEAFAAEPQS